jgi:hypothetical protein
LHSPEATSSNPTQQTARNHAKWIDRGCIKAGVFACPGRNKNHCEAEGCRQTLKMNLSGMDQLKFDACTPLKPRQASRPNKLPEIMQTEVACVRNDAVRERCNLEPKRCIARTMQQLLKAEQMWLESATMQCASDAILSRSDAMRERCNIEPKGSRKADNNSDATAMTSNEQQAVAQIKHEA